MKKKFSGDWAVALVVVVCSIVLFLALTFALTGTFINSPSRTVRVNFRDATGINLSANVKYAGARAGEVVAMRMLTAEERLASGDPENLVQVTLALNRTVPDLPADIEMSVAADTLLSDKFVLISGGNPASPKLKDDAVVQGVTPVTFDKLVRNMNHLLVRIDRFAGGGSGWTGEVGGLVVKVRETLTRMDELIADASPVLAGAGSVVKEADTLVTDARTLVSNAGTLVTDATGLVDSNKAGITRAVSGLESAATSFDRLANRANTFLATNESRLNATLRDIRATSENLKVTSAYAIILTKSLAQRPQRLLWGGRPPELPTREQILESQNQLP